MGNSPLNFAEPKTILKKKVPFKKEKRRKKKQFSGGPVGRGLSTFTAEKHV